LKGFTIFDEDISKAIMIKVRKILGRINRIEFLFYSIILVILWITNYHLMKFDVIRYLVYYFLIVFFGYVLNNICIFA